MRHALLGLATSWAMCLPSYADTSPVVVELFTSQGCSSCPPADEIMSELAAREDVIALSLHVDYWDYIGWKDEFADPAHGARQRSYAAQAGRRSIYTPEMIVNGVSDIVGAKPMELAMAIEKHKAESAKVSLQITRQANGQVAILAEALADELGAMDVVMLRYQPTRISSITRGENAGRTLEYVNVTQDWQVLGSWDGKSALSMSAAAADDLPIAVLVQAENQGPIRAAAQID
jgi:hypothetical protein